MLHTVLVVLHAAAGTIAVGCGAAALRRTGWFAGFYWSLLAMGGFVLAAVVVGWPDLDTVTRLVFAALLVLAAAMVWRAELARRLRRDGRYPTRATVAHIGFSLVGLLDAFLVVTVLNLGATTLVVVGIAIAVALVGHLLVGRAQRRLLVGSPAG